MLLLGSFFGPWAWGLDACRLGLRARRRRRQWAFRVFYAMPNHKRWLPAAPTACPLSKPGLSEFCDQVLAWTCLQKACLEFTSEFRAWDADLC